MLPPFPPSSPLSAPVRLSVVITNHNYAAYLPAALAGVLAQADAGERVIVVDSARRTTRAPCSPVTAPGFRSYTRKIGAKEPPSTPASNRRTATPRSPWTPTTNCGRAPREPCRRRTFDLPFAHRVDARTALREERRILALADGEVVFTPRDRALPARHTRLGTEIATIPLGWNVPETACDPAGAHPPTLLCVANFTHPPDVEAALRLERRIFPAVQDAHPAVGLGIVGAAPPGELLSLEETRRQTAERARAWALRDLSFSSMADRYEGLYARLEHRRGAQGR